MSGYLNPGIPANCPKVNSVRFENAASLVDDFMIFGAAH